MIDERAYALLDAIRSKQSARFRDLQLIITNPRTLSSKLEYLRQNDLILKNHEGYELTDKGLEVYEALSKARQLLAQEYANPINIERIPHAILAPVLAKYVNILYSRFEKSLLGVLVFGSLARGTWTNESDIDLLIVVKDWREPLWARLDQLWPLRSRLRNASEYKKAAEKGCLPIIQDYPLSEAEARHFHRIYLDAAVEGIILYEKERFLSSLMDKVRSRLQQAGAKRIMVPGKGHYWLIEKEYSNEPL